MLCKDYTTLCDLTLTATSQGLDSFIELVASSIEYGESTSYQLQPAKKASLNIPQLRRIHELAGEVRNRQAKRASGL